MLQKSHATSRANKAPKMYASNAHETRSDATPTHINILPSVTSSRSLACRFSPDEGCGMNLLSILL